MFSTHSHIVAFSHHRALTKITMPTNDHVKKAFSLIENDKSKVLGLKAGDQAIQPGQYLARSGPYFSPP